MVTIRPQPSRGCGLVSSLKLLAFIILILYALAFSFNFLQLSSSEYTISPTNHNEALFSPPNGTLLNQDTACAGAKCKRAVLVGSAKDIANYVPHTVKQLQRVGNLFGDYRVVISEDGSGDNTAELFRVNLAERGDVIQSPEFAGDRLSRLAQARNVYLDHVKRKYNDWDYMIVFDLDFTCTLNLTTFEEAIRLDSAWDASLSFSIGDYWDWLAFQPPPNSDLSRESFLGLLTTLPDDQFIRVGSAFAITAMYKVPKLMDVRYGAEGMLIDHVILHGQLREKYGDNAVLVSPMCFCQNDCMKKLT